MYRSATSGYAAPNPSAIYPFTYSQTPGFVESLPATSLFGNLDRKIENIEENNEKREPQGEYQTSSPKDTMIIKKESVLLENGPVGQLNGEEEDGDVGGGSEEDDDDDDGEPTSPKVARLDNWSPRGDKNDDGLREIKPVTTPLPPQNDAPSNYMAPPPQCFAPSSLSEIPAAQMISYQIYGQFPSQYHPHMASLQPPPQPSHTPSHHQIYTSLANDNSEIVNSTGSDPTIHFPPPPPNQENPLSSAKDQTISAMASQWQNVVSVFSKPIDSIN